MARNYRSLTQGVILMKIWSIRAILACLVVITVTLEVRSEVVTINAGDKKIVVSDSSRIVSVGGTVSEIVSALGLESRIVGVDSSSVYPTSLAKLPQVGYQRTLAAEGVLSLHPSVILASSEAGPPAVIEQLHQSETPYVTVPIIHSIEGTKSSIRLLSHALKREENGEEIIRKLEVNIAEANKKIMSVKSRPKVLFIYARGAGTLNISGRDTAADAMITLAGGVNAVSGYTAYKPMTAEALVAAAPDYILITSRGLESIGGVQGLLNQPGIPETPAGKNRRIISMDDLLLLGFGPRLGSALLELTESIHSPKLSSLTSNP